MAVHYYIVADDGKQVGPYTLEMLRAVPLRPNTYVWHAGMDNWARAYTLNELADLFPELQPKAPVSMEGCPNPHLALAIISTAFCLLGIAAIVKSVLVRSRWEQGRYDDARWLARTSVKLSIASILIGVGSLILMILIDIAEH